MMSLESRLAEIWEKYRSHREAESNAAETAKQAASELAELNRRRAEKGLPYVGEQREFGLGQQYSGISQSIYSGGLPPKTWRDHMDEEILAAVRQWFSAKEAA